jgi:hypothetical protein
MVRRGSTVRVRQRALQKSRKAGLSLSDRLALSTTCSAYGADYGAFRSGSPVLSRRFRLLCRPDPCRHARAHVRSPSRTAPVSGARHAWSRPVRGARRETPPRARHLRPPAPPARERRRTARACRARLLPGRTVLGRGARQRRNRQAGPGRYADAPPHSREPRDPPPALPLHSTPALARLSGFAA